jgi:ornithine--oxo-acid transaminase
MAAGSAPLVAGQSYSEYVNPQWAKLLGILGLSASYKQCTGVELHTEDGRRILDFLSGYCVHNTGHNHPYIVQALKSELDQLGPVMLQSHVPELAGELAKMLCERAGGKLKKAFFASSGSEGVEAAIKFSRATTGRAGLLSAKGSFHGLTAGALSLMTDSYWRDGFGPLLRDTAAVPFGDPEALMDLLQSRRFAAFVVEPIQAEAGINVPTMEYLKAAESMCRNTGTLFVLDEVQTGLHRTGPFLAAHHFGVEPDIVVLAKALSGGLVPISAVLMSDEVYEGVYSSLKRSIVHTSTFSENSLSLRAGIATLQVLEKEALGDRARELGGHFREMLRRELAPYEMVKEIRGLGMLSGIEFRAPRQMRLRVPFEAFMKVHPAMFGQIVVMRMFREKNILTQICGNNFMVLKAAPPLVVTEEQLDSFVEAIREVIDLMHSSSTFWAEALLLARRAANI